MIGEVEETFMNVIDINSVISETPVKIWGPLVFYYQHSAFHYLVGDITMEFLSEIGTEVIKGKEQRIIIRSSKRKFALFEGGYYF